MKSKAKLLSLWTLGIVVVLCGTLAVFVLTSTPPQRAVEPSGAPAAYQRPAANPLKNAYFGELHLHTSYSLDALMFQNLSENGPRTAYRFAQGEEIVMPSSGLRHRLKVPLDFAAVTDHAETFGLLAQCQNPDTRYYHALTCYGLRYKLKLIFGRAVASIKQEGQERGRHNEAVCGADGFLCTASAREIWQDIQAAAEEFYQPGKFTTFIGYEYSPTLNQTGMLHRNVIFRGSQVPDSAFSALDGFAEDLLRWLDTSCQGDCQALSIPHNPNWSWGLMFGDSNSDATPLTRENLLLRAKYERLVEIFQVKGGSECAAGVGNNDEQCAFENLWPACSAEQLVVDPKTGQHAPRCVGPNDSVRQILKKGLAEEQKWGFNPFKFGFVGATDNHNGAAGDTEEDTWGGHGGEPDSTAEYRLGYETNMVADVLGFPLIKLNPGGLAGIWAPENTREALFDAMKAKETFATSGTRVRVRLFAGFDYPSDLHQQADMIETAYAKGVPMGGDLVAAAPVQAPRLLVQAMRDANSAPLQKIQIVKGWLADGESHEQVYDVVCSDGLQPDAKTHLCPNNGAKVNLSDCSISADKGAAELATTWTDPDFVADQSAFYYARVLENPVCRWSQHDANAIGKPHPDNAPATVQERAWTSPIWYGPQG
jgi:hypothetical protein